MAKNPLATPDQIAIEDLAMRLYRSPPVEAAMARARAVFLTDPRAARPSGRDKIELNLSEMAFSAACSVASMTQAKA